jgi:dihydropteroate synthase
MASHLTASRTGTTRARPQIMGILNLTPDSFSDGGSYASVAEGVARGLQLAADGADIVDVGGESTRPGALPVPAEEQRRRILPVIEGLSAALPPHVVISIDTRLSTVAEAALERGARMINDISAGRYDGQMFRLAALARVPLVLMHMQGSPETMQREPCYRDVVAEVEAFLRERMAAACAAGVQPGDLILDPGIGFGKTRQHNLALLGALPRLAALGCPLLLGVSRKRFMGSICRVDDPRQLLPATCACTALGVLAGVSIFRVHDVAENRQAADVAMAIRLAGDAERAGPSREDSPVSGRS